MDAIITGAVALQQIRRSRRGDVIVEPADLVHVPHVHDHVALAAWLNSDAMRSALVFVGGRPVSIRAKDATLRGHAKSTKSHVTSGTFASHSFWELLLPELMLPEPSKSVGNKSAPTGERNHVYVDGPELCVVNAANELLSRVRSGAVSKTIAVLKLATLIMELCGTYSCDPLNPRVAAATFNVEPTTSISKIGRFLKGFHYAKGVKLVREALRWACDGSRSEMESFTYIALTCPPRFGGTSVGVVSVNKALKLSSRQLSLISHRTITPDFYVERYKAIVEYLGKGPHEGDEARNEDRARWKDYSTLCLRSFPMIFNDVRTPRAFNAFCRRLVQGMEASARRQEMHRLSQLFRDEEFQKAQVRLFASLLPPKTCYDEYLCEKLDPWEQLWGF